MRSQLHTSASRASIIAVEGLSRFRSFRSSLPNLIVAFETSVSTQQQRHVFGSLRPPADLHGDWLLENSIADHGFTFSHAM